MKPILAGLQVVEPSALTLETNSGGCSLRLLTGRG